MSLSSVFPLNQENVETLLWIDACWYMPGLDGGMPLSGRKEIWLLLSELARKTLLGCFGKVFSLPVEFLKNDGGEIEYSDLLKFGKLWFRLKRDEAMMIWKTRNGMVHQPR